MTFLFADIEGSTKLAHALSKADWAALLAQHDTLVDATVADHRGAVVKHEGDGMFAAFPDATSGAAAAVAISRAIAGRAWPGEARPRLRMGLHAATAQLTADRADYLGLDVHYAARLTGAANGGQILLSDSAFEGLGGVVPEGATVQSVGRRRVRDFDQPLPMHRLIVPGAADDDRPLRTIAESDLPEALTTFVGREREVAAVSILLERSRMVTLTGPGGAGKTRLAVSVAAHVRDRFRDGVTFVELAPIRDVALVRGVIATAVGVVEVPGRPITDVLREHLAEHQQLLVLDNLEQLLPDGAGIAGELVRGAPQVAVLASSREPLRVAGEQEYPVPPLAETDARELFLERARLVRPNLELSAADSAAVDQIVDQLAGLPLAIELAAARIRLFAPSAILERLGRSLDLLSGGGARDLPERQQTLRATLAWSHDLLTPAEQVIFRRWRCWPTSGHPRWPRRSPTRIGRWRSTSSTAWPHSSTRACCGSSMRRVATCASLAMPSSASSPRSGCRPPASRQSLSDGTLSTSAARSGSGGRTWPRRARSGTCGRWTRRSTTCGRP